MEPRGPAGGGSSGAHRDVEIGGGQLSKRNGSGPGRQTDPGRRSRRQSDRIVRADAVTRRTEVYYADLSSMRRLPSAVAGLQVVPSGLVCGRSQVAFDCASSAVEEQRRNGGAN